ncbi:hypothetical protein ECANGB1_2730 [Enterospora canceri]|uniref:Uncharacterized protein n=1 Tax=Enterospora canceri TaxID=1081671 RepID=A0A1Y1S5Q4_9MICR|nr:hypothetical protein ECANGB1_2730 [Enterospora canceri]
MLSRTSICFSLILQFTLSATCSSCQYLLLVHHVQQVPF